MITITPNERNLLFELIGDSIAETASVIDVSPDINHIRQVNACGDDHMAQPPHPEDVFDLYINREATLTARRGPKKLKDAAVGGTGKRRGSFAHNGNLETQHRRSGGFGQSL